MKKSSYLYKLILAIWLCCFSGLMFLLYRSIASVVTGSEFFIVREGFIIFFLILNFFALGFMWLGSIKDLMFSLYYVIHRKKIMKKYDAINKIEVKDTPRILLVYCTCNDFNSSALSECMKQDYSNVKTVILDDSSKEEYLKEIDEFAMKNSLEVVRRVDKTGFKAGNLNNYLKNHHDYDYFVVLDSDEVLPRDYCKKILKYFYYNKKIGAVQACHVASQGENAFQSLMGLSVKSNGQTCQVVKNFYGSNALIGHGMTISRACYEKTGGFPLVVAEDISFAIDIKNNGYEIVYAPDIICEEEFPIDYLCLKKRQCKWTQGNVEFIKKYDKSLRDSKMSWFEKLDVKLSHYSLPIVPVLSNIVVFSVIALGFLGYKGAIYSYLMIGLMTLFLIAPLIPDLFVWGKTKMSLKLIPYFLLNLITYASLSPMMIKTIFLGLFGKKAKFIITPKTAKEISIKEAFTASLDSLLFGVLIIVLGYFSTGTIVPFLFIILGCLGAPFAILSANIHVHKKTQTEPKIRRSFKNATFSSRPLQAKTKVVLNTKFALTYEDASCQTYSLVADAPESNEFILVGDMMYAFC